jgi:phosphoribosyl-ATP pyrophosphohydrolase/phosphoribosyl-AMP cyclohydrolase
MATEKPELKYDVDFEGRKLLPAIVQQYDTGEVLMLAWVDDEAIARTCESGTTWFWSRSRKEYWNKGATSGNTQRVIEVRYDCDEDAVLFVVDQGPEGVACHTGERTCFYRRLCGGEAELPVRIGPVLEELAGVIEGRREASAEESYTAKLLQGPADKLLKKIGEEATEVVIAAGAHDRDQLRYEAADLVYHLLVTLAREGLGPDDLAQELAKRRR